MIQVRILNIKVKLSFLKAEKKFTLLISMKIKFQYAEIIVKFTNVRII